MERIICREEAQKSAKKEKSKKLLRVACNRQLVTSESRLASTRAFLFVYFC